MLCKKLSRALFCLNRIKHSLNQRALRTLYYSLFHSHLLYCNLIFTCTSQSNINRVSILQKKAIRAITNSTYNYHTAPLFLTLKILPFQKIINLNKSLFMHSIHYKYANSSFNDVWTLNNQHNHITLWETSTIFTYHSLKQTHLRKHLFILSLNTGMTYLKS